MEIEGQRKLEASCSTLAAEGMVVQTETQADGKILRSRGREDSGISALMHPAGNRGNSAVAVKVDNM